MKEILEIFNNKTGAALQQPGDFIDSILKHDHIRLTSVELGILWLQYLSDSMILCMMKVFKKNAKDNEIKTVIEYVLGLSVKHLERIKDIFDEEGAKIPIGFTDQDIILNAPRLFSDSFYLYYMKALAKAAIQTYGLSFSMAARYDVRQFLGECLASSAELDDRVTGLLLSKGLYIRPPYFQMPDRVEFVKRKSFLGGIFGSRRPLNGVEIMHLFIGSQAANLGKALITGFSQTARERKVRDYLLRGREIAQKHIEVFNSFLNRDDLPAPATWETDVTDSAVAPYSDKLMLFQTVFLVESVIGNFGVAIGSSIRKDIVVNFLRFMGELMRYVEDGGKLTVEFGWMEKPPHSKGRFSLGKGVH